MSSDGKYLERLVQLIEKSLDPNAVVEHDVQMPILNSQIGAKTQCDVVIRKGEPPRETITIVEVQDRKNKPVANDFRGWQKKLQEVGAQHLICVSREGFTASEKEKASQSGNSIHLITIKELDAESIPLDFFNLKFIFEDFDIEPLGKVKVNASGSDLDKFNLKEKYKNSFDLDLNSKVYSTDKKELISLYDLCKRHVSPSKQEDSGKNKLEFRRDDEIIFLLFEGNFIKIELDFEYEWTYKVTKIPVNTLAYEQDEHGTLAWVLEAGYESERGFVGFKMPVTKVRDNYHINNLEIEVPENEMMDFILYRRSSS